MILFWSIMVPLAGGLLAWYSERFNRMWPRVISLAALLFTFIWLLVFRAGQQVSKEGMWLSELNRTWIPQLGISFHLAMDGFSLLLVLLTMFLGIMSVAASWREIQDRVGAFHFNLMAILAGITGVFISMDLFIFYFFWELMLVPMYFIIDQWGHENRHYAAVKFFIFTQVSGLLMLLSILGLYFLHGVKTGAYTFDYQALLGASSGSRLEFWLMAGFAIAFAVKLPVVPVHSWLPDAHTEAPTAGSVILAGLLLKTGAYGFVRFVIPFFPDSAFAFAPAAMVLGVIGILYGAAMAFAQTDLKRLVAYTSVSHMGFVLIGVFAWNSVSLQGSLMQIICHGIATGALFIIVGSLQDRIHTREMRAMGGLWSTVPRMGGTALFFALASLGLPGLGNFVAEFLVLLGTYRVNVAVTAAASVGFVAATVYSLWMIQRAFLGENVKGWKVPDYSGREMAIMAAMIVVLVWLGLYPQAVFNTSGRSFDSLQEVTRRAEYRPASLFPETPLRERP